MPKKMLIDATHAEETRVVVVDGNKVEEFDFESENKRQLAGNIYLAKVTRVEPSLQAAFVDYGGNRHGFLAFSEIHPDYYQIPVADREALLEEERAYAEAMKARDEEDDAKSKPARGRSRSRSRTKAAKSKSPDAVVSTEPSASQITGMETIDLDDDDAETDLDVTEFTTEVSDASDDGASDADAGDVAETSDEGGEDSDNTAKDANETDEASAQDTDEDNTDEDESDEDDGDKTRDASFRDESIESVSDDDDSEDIRPIRKPRPRRYKIQEVVKVRQILLVQVVKEERGNKGAALTTYLSLPGRYCVLMPNTARGGGISRKITNAADRKKLKEIASDIDIPKGAGLIIRTAGAKRTKSEIKRDYEYLQRLWEQVRELTLKSIAPAKIYEEGDLIKRTIRDLYSREIDEILVEGERGYRTAKDFMKMIMPSHAKNVKFYADQMPLFARHHVESYLAGMFNPTVQLKSGGYIVIGVTEALVAIDVNSGRATKEGSIEETALKTNLEAADEVARQLRLRDLAGLIVIDFIDMDERRNNSAVEKRMKDRLKSDRARIQVGRISGFGLMEMSRQRLRPGMIEATTQPCLSCHGTGLIRSDDNLSLSILRQIEEEGVRGRSREVLVRCPVAIANFLINQKREHIAQIEIRYGMSVRIEGDPHLISPDYSMEKFKQASRTVPDRNENFVSMDSQMLAVEAEEEAEAQDQNDEETQEAETEKPKRRRRRRRRKKGGDANGEQNKDQSETGSETDMDAPEVVEAKANDSKEVTQADESANDSEPPEEVAKDETAEKEAKPKRKRAPRRRTSKKDKTAEDAAEAEVKEPEVKEAEVKEAEAKPAETAEAEAASVQLAQPEPTSEPESVVELVKEPIAETPKEPEPVAETIVTELVEEEKPAKPKRRGWWSVG